MSIQLKLLLGLILAVGLWQLLQNDAVSSAALALFLDGEIPVTHAIVPPSFVIGVSAVLVFLVTLALLSRFQSKPTPGTNAAEYLPRVEHVQPVVPPVTDLVYPGAKRSHLPRRLWLQHNWMILDETMHSRSAAFAVTVKYNFWRLRRVSGAYAEGASAWLSSIAVPTAHATSRAARRFWHWASPLLWQFDGWLERQTKVAKEKLLDKIIGRENTHF